MENVDIRNWITKTKRVHMYEVANRLGISQMMLTRWLQIPLTDERKAKIVNTVNAIVIERDYEELEMLMGNNTNNN